MLRSHKQKCLVTAGIIFVLCVFLGGHMAANRALWLDELYSQTESTQKQSYLKIIRGPIPGGSCFPLFFLIQKSLTDMTGNHIPDGGEDAAAKDRTMRIVLRLPSNIYMSLAIAILFFYFAVNFSWVGGWLALGSALSSFMVWAYWAEARQYALWFSLTTLQAVLLFEVLMKDKEINLRKLVPLFLVQCLLAITIIFSMWQILIASILVWRMRFSQNWRALLFLLCPLGVWLYYFSVTPSFTYNYPSVARIIEVLLYTFPAERLLMLAALIGMMFLSTQGLVRDARWGFRMPQDLLPVALFAAGIFLSALVTIAAILVKNVGHTYGADLTFRYFIYLTPLSIMVQTFLFSSVINVLKGRHWLLFNAVTVMMTIILMRFLETYIAVFGWYSF